MMQTSRLSILPVMKRSQPSHYSIGIDTVHMSDGNCAAESCAQFCADKPFTAMVNSPLNRRDNSLDLTDDQSKPADEPRPERNRGDHRDAAPRAPRIPAPIPPRIE